jgi:hypothetical protein
MLTINPAVLTAAVVASDKVYDGSTPTPSVIAPAIDSSTSGAVGCELAGLNLTSREGVSMPSNVLTQCPATEAIGSARSEEMSGRLPTSTRPRSAL